MRLEYRFQTSFPLQAPLISFSSTFRYVHPSLCVCVCACVCVCVCDGDSVWCADGVVPFLRPIVLHQAQRDVISLSQAQPPTMLHYLCMCVWVCICVCACVCLCEYSHPANNASLHISPRAPLTFPPVSLPSESHVICSSHIYRADLYLLRSTHTHAYTCIHMHTHMHTLRCWCHPDISAHHE